MSQQMTAAFLRQFVRFGIPLHCERVRAEMANALKSCDEEHQTELADLQARAVGGHPNFLEYSRVKVAEERLRLAHKQKRKQIETDARQPHFQRWVATDEDFKRLSVWLVMSDDPVTFGIDKKFKRTGDDHWHYEVAIEQFLDSAADDSEAASQAADHLNQKIAREEFVRQSKSKPTEPVVAENIRQVHSERSTKRRCAAERMIGGTVADLQAWATSERSPMSPEVVAALVPSKDICEQWAEDERLVWSRFPDFRASLLPKDRPTERAVEIRFKNSLSVTDRVKLSEWRRLRLFQNRAAARILNVDERKVFEESCYILKDEFWKYRHSFNEERMAEIVSQPPSYIRSALHVSGCFRDAMNAAEALYTSPLL